MQKRRNNDRIYRRTIPRNSNRDVHDGTNASNKRG